MEKEKYFLPCETDSRNVEISCYRIAIDIWV